jgi:hypothetical protein
VFDADLEYSTGDIPALLEPVVNGEASVVYGARIRGSRTLLHSLVYGFGSKATTVLANVLFGSRLHDMHTCLKLIPLPLFRQLTLSESGFGLDTEMTCEVLRRGVRPHEVPCSYHGRSVAEGKKISARDGVECLKVLFQVRFRGRISLDSSSDAYDVATADDDMTHPFSAIRAADLNADYEALPAAGAGVIGLFSEA